MQHLHELVKMSSMYNSRTVFVLYFNKLCVVIRFVVIIRSETSSNERISYIFIYLGGKLLSERLADFNAL